MAEDMRAEVLEMCVNACEKHTSNNENAAKMVKEQLDKRCTFSEDIEIIIMSIHILSIIKIVS